MFSLFTILHLSFSQSTTLLPFTSLVVSLALYPVPPISYSFALLFLGVIIIINKGGQSIPHFSFLVKKEVYSVECGLIVINLTPRDGKSNTTNTIGALMELS